MSRPKTEHGKRVALSVKVSEPKAQAVDARRGILSRAAYLESLIDADLARFTGKPEPSGPYAEARAAIEGDSWLDDVARASVSAAQAKFAAPAATSEPEHATPARRSKAAPHRCPTKGWCGTCNEWKGKR
jgi:hypothetical protein